MDKLRRDNRINASTEHVIVTPGAVTAARTSLMALVEPGDEVLLPDPCWPDYLMQVVSLGGRPLRYKLLPNAGLLPDGTIYVSCDQSSCRQQPFESNTGRLDEGYTH